MSELAIADGVRKRSWARPGSAHDALVRLLNVLLPTLIGVLMAYLAMAPLSKSQDISFILDKNKVEVARERMRVQAAQYRGQDASGRPFTIAAGSAVQATSVDPIVNIDAMSARILLDDGPASLQARHGRYNLETAQMAVPGSILILGPDNYRLSTRDVIVDLNQRTLASQGSVEGTMPLGNFSADRLEANLAERRVVLSGRARLHIVQGIRS
jgi:lipopolysaccharide export system protein LptC